MTFFERNIVRNDRLVKQRNGSCEKLESQGAIVVSIGERHVENVRVFRPLVILSLSKVNIKI